MPGTSANCGNSLEPVPLESNWHFKINLCQEPSGSILQQSRVHSALAIRQLKIQGWGRWPWSDPSAPHTQNPCPALQPLVGQAGRGYGQLLPHSRARGWGTAGKEMSGLLSNPSRCPDPGVEQGCSAHVNKTDSCHPKNRSSSIHPWPARQCWPAQAQTAQGLVLLGQTPGSLLQPCPGLAPFGSTAIARGSNPSQESFSPIGRQAKPKSALPWSTHARHHHLHFHPFCTFSLRHLQKLAKY